MSALQPFSPHAGSTQIATLVANTAQLLTFDKTNHQLRIFNMTVAVVHVRTYSSTGTAAVASVADFPAAPNMVSVITKGQGQDAVSLFGTAAGSVYLSTGDGW